MSSTDIIVDLTNYRDTVGSRVAPGRYRVQVEDVEVTKSNAGNPMINLFLRVMGGEFEGQTLVDRLPQTPKAMFRTVAFMQAIGMPTPRKRLKINTANFVGRIVDVDVEDGEPYNGRIRSEIRGFSRVSQEDVQEDEDIEDIDLASDNEGETVADSGEVPADEEGFEEVDLSEIEV